MSAHPPRVFWRRLVAFAVGVFGKNTSGAVTTATFRTPAARAHANDEILNTVWTPHAGLTWALMLIASAWGLAAGRRRLGKWRVGRRIAGDGQAWSREIWRIGPILVLALGQAVSEVTPMMGAAGANVTFLLGLFAALGVGLAWFYIWPLLRWRGALRWDAYAGFVTERAT